MIDFVVPPARATAARTVNHNRLDHVISQVGAGDRAAFRRLYAFMAMRVWHLVAKARLGPADAVAVARSTFVEVWHSALAVPHRDGRDWMARVTTGRVDDRLRIIGSNGRHGVDSAGPGVGVDRQLRATLVDYDAHVHRELTALLGAGAAIVRTGPGVFIRIDDLDQALSTVAAATPATAATGAH